MAADYSIPMGGTIVAYSGQHNSLCFNLTNMTFNSEYHRWHGVDKEGNRWVVVSDGPIHGNLYEAKQVY